MAFLLGLVVSSMRPWAAPVPIRVGMERMFGRAPQAIHHAA